MYGGDDESKREADRAFLSVLAQANLAKLVKMSDRHNKQREPPLWKTIALARAVQRALKKEDTVGAQRRSDERGGPRRGGVT